LRCALARLAHELIHEHGFHEVDWTGMMPALRPLVPIPATGYTRRFEAAVDTLATEAIVVRGRMRDHRMAHEQAWTVRTPAYVIVEAAAHVSEGEPEIAAPELAERLRAIAGLAIGPGLTREIRDRLGELPGAREYLWLAIEMARVSQQVYRLPNGFGDRFLPIVSHLPSPSREARLAWETDRAWMPELANSCHTYRDASADLFAERAVRCTFATNLTSPAADRQAVFERAKRLALSWGPGGALRCSSSMRDTVHDIEVELRIDPDGTIRQASSRGQRLPYAGLCEEAQARTPMLEGRRLDGAFTRLVAATVGGALGCTHLFDLACDALRMLELTG
jgi:hypothetical protein